MLSQCHTHLAGALPPKIQYYLVSLNPSTEQTPSEIYTWLSIHIRMALAIFSEQSRTLCSCPEGLTTTFGHKNRYFALDGPPTVFFNTS